MNKFEKQKQLIFNSFVNEMLQQIQKVKIIDKEIVAINIENKAIVRPILVKGIKKIKQKFINKHTLTNIILLLDNVWYPTKDAWY